MDRADYFGQLRALLPRGDFWRLDGAAGLSGILDSVAGELARVDSRADALEQEADPRATFEMLEDWERVAGLPDPCLSLDQSLGARRAWLVQRLTARGGSSVAYFLGLAASLGYEITIAEHRPIECGVSRCGDTSILVHNGLAPLIDGDGTPVLDTDGDPVLARRVRPAWEMGPPDIRACWTVAVYSRPRTWFRTGGGGGVCGVDHMVNIGAASDLECLFSRLKPAGTEVIFTYPGSAG